MGRRWRLTKRQFVDALLAGREEFVSIYENAPPYVDFWNRFLKERKRTAGLQAGMGETAVCALKVATPHSKLWKLSARAVCYALCLSVENQPNTDQEWESFVKSLLKSQSCSTHRKQSLSQPRVG